MTAIARKNIQINLEGTRKREIIGNEKIKFMNGKLLPNEKIKLAKAA